MGYSFLALFLLLISALIFFLTTTPGFYTAIKLANFALPGKIHVHHLQGRLINHAHCAFFSYEDDQVAMHGKNAEITWQLLSLLHKQFILSNLQAEDITIKLKEASQVVEKKTNKPFTLSKLPLQIDIAQLHIKQLKIERSGRVHQFDMLTLQATLTDQLWVIKQFSTRYADWNFMLSAQAQPNPPYQLSANLGIKTITAAKTKYIGEIHVGGDLALYHWQGKLKGPTQAALHGTLKNGQEIDSEINWQNAEWPLDGAPTIESAAGHIMMQGTLVNLLIDLNARFKAPVPAEWDLHAHLINKRLSVKSILHLLQSEINCSFFYDEQARPHFKGNAQGINLNFTDLSLPLTAAQFKADFTGNTLQTLQAKTTLSGRLGENLFFSTITYIKQQLEAKFSLGTNKIVINATPPYQWQATASLPQPNLLHPALTGLRTIITANSTLLDAQHGKLRLTLSPGTLQSPQDSTLPAIKFIGGNITANLTPKTLIAKGNFKIDNQSVFDLFVNMPKFRVDKDSFLTQKIDGKINLKIQALDFLQGLSPDIDKPHGQLNFNLTALGTIDKPQVNGVLTLTNGSVFIRPLNLTLSPVEAKLQSQNKKWTAAGSVQADGRKIMVQGEGSFAPEVSGAIKINGENFPLMKTAEYIINISPQLAIDFTAKMINLHGIILIPSAQLKPLSFSNSINLSEDAVFVTDEKQTPIPFNLTTDVQVKMGQDVAIAVEGLNGFLEGAIQVKQIPQSELFATGELSVRDGKYQAYGQDLIIDRGQLLFTGGSISNPGISLRAVRYFNNATSRFAGSNQLFDFNTSNIQTLDFGDKTTVGIDVSGRLNSTKIKLFSIPPTLSQADILSMLILGKPASQASKSGGQLLLTAISSMNLNSGSKGMQLLEQLKQSLGFDFNLQNNSPLNQTTSQKTNQINDGTTFVVGKSLSKRLYLSYNVGIFQQNSNLFTLKYLLNKFFSIQVSASDTGNGIDLLYTHQK